MDTTTPPPTSRSAAPLPKPVGRADAGRTSRRTWRPLRIARLVGVLVLVLLLVTLPLSVGDRFWLSVLATSGVYTLGAVGLNLLTGYLGEASLGHAFFMGVGAYVGIYVGDTLGAPLLIWMVAVLAAGALVGAISGPLALRLRGG